MYDYLAGPYRADDLSGKVLNLGRLFTYKIHLEDQYPLTPIVCYPLECASLDAPGTLDYLDWMGKALELVRSSSRGWFTPGWELSSGSLMEHKLMQNIELPYHELEPLSSSRASQIYAILLRMQAKPENGSLTRCALTYLKTNYGEVGWEREGGSYA